VRELTHGRAACPHTKPRPVSLFIRPIVSSQYGPHSRLAMANHVARRYRCLCRFSCRQSGERPNSGIVGDMVDHLFGCQLAQFWPEGSVINSPFNRSILWALVQHSPSGCRIDDFRRGRHNWVLRRFARVRRLYLPGRAKSNHIRCSPHHRYNWLIVFALVKPKHRVISVKSMRPEFSRQFSDSMCNIDCDLCSDLPVDANNTDFAICFCCSIARCSSFIPSGMDISPGQDIVWASDEFWKNLSLHPLSIQQYSPKNILTNLKDAFAFDFNTEGYHKLSNGVKEFIRVSNWLEDDNWHKVEKITIATAVGELMKHI
jgi:hypothetical protein